MTGNPEQTIPNEAFQARKDAFLSALSDPGLKAQAPWGLDKFWMDEVLERFDPAVERGQRWGNKLAKVIQFADGQIPYNSSFIDSYFERFGAHVTAVDGRRLAVKSNSLTEVTSNIPQVEYDYFTDHLNEIPDGSFTVVDPQGRRCYLVVETDIEGVRIFMDGQALTHSQGNLRPMFLIKIDDAPRLNLRLPEDEEAERKQAQKTFRELHGRDTAKGSNMTEHERQESGAKVIQGSEEEQMVAHAALAWVMEAKSADEIKITPTKLKENPNLKTEQERIDIVGEALKLADDNLRLTYQGLGRPVIGVMSYGLAIIVQILQMTPEEILKDGEAMSDLVEYLEEAACSRLNPNALGHTDIIGPPPTGDPFTEIAKKLKETWELPKNTAFHNFPFMYQRINWNNRTQQSNRN